MADKEKDKMNENPDVENDGLDIDITFESDSKDENGDAEKKSKSNGYNDYEGDSLFQAIDVSEPRAPIKEIDIIEEALAIRRRDWIRTNLSYIYAVAGLILVLVIALLIYIFFQSSNPMSRFTSSLSKNFNSSFQFDVQVSEDDQPMMRYTGAIDVNHSKHTVLATYEADYERYQYSGAVYADKHIAKKGSYYEKKWLIRDCMDNAQDFFDFDRDFRSGGFDAGAFLRFTGLTSDFSTRELNSFMNTMLRRLSTDSAIVTITGEKVGGEERYHYDVSLQALFEMVEKDGASIFYRASDYDKFCEDYALNKDVIADAKCSVDFTVNGAGNMTFLEVKIVVNGTEYDMTCQMSDFGNAQVEIPQGFYKAAEITPPQ